MVRLEEFRENEYGMYIPLSAFVQEGELTICACPEAEEAARWLDGLGPDAVWREEVWEELDRRLFPLADARGYVPDAGYTHGVSLHFELSDPAKLDRSLIRPDTKRVKWNRVTCLTETVLDEESRNCPIFGTVQDGKLLSFANLNSDDGEVADIGVETAPGEEGKGYAASNAAALALYFLKKGRRVFYETEASNLPSVRIAEKLGMTQTVAEYHYVCFCGGEEAF